MVKRVLAFALWGYAAWYAFAYVADATGGPPIVALVGGLIVGAVVAIDPRHVVWKRTRVAQTPADPMGAVPAPTR